MEAMSLFFILMCQQGRDMHYNLDYALRLCTQNGRTQSCVHIYSQMGLYEEAVNLALKVKKSDDGYQFVTDKNLLVS